MNALINPNRIQLYSQKLIDRARGQKIYRAAFVLNDIERFSRRRFRTATEAKTYAVLVKQRCVRWYDWQIAKMSASPAAEKGSEQ